MKWLHSDILKERPVVKKLIIVLVAVNAIILGLLLFGPSKKSDASERGAANSAGNGQEAVALNAGEEADDGEDESGSASEESEDSREDRDREEEDRDSSRGDEEEDADRSDRDEENEYNTSDRDEENEYNSSDRSDEENEYNSSDRSDEETDESYADDTRDSDDNEDNEDNEEDADSEDGPILELTDEHVTLGVGEPFEYQKYIKTMEDRDGSSLSRYVHLSEIVNTRVPGEYTVTFRITSPIDGKSTSKDLRVTVE